MKDFDIENSTLEETFDSISEALGQFTEDDPSFTISSENKEFVTHELEEQTFDPNSNDGAIDALESFSLSFLSQIDEAIPQDNNGLDNDGAVLRLVDRRYPAGENAQSFRALLFPRRRPNNARNIAALLRVIELSHDALITDIPTTKRDVFYKDPALFKTQSVLVDDLAATLSLNRSELNVRASSKGLFSGSCLNIELRQGGAVNGSDFEGSLNPCDAEIGQLVLSPHISWVLVVEKEAIFQSLCRMGFASHKSLIGPGVIVTGKGYPDVATRELVYKLSSDLPISIPVLALVDADPHGIDIASVFKYGSRSMEHQNTILRASRLEWIGVYSSELESFGIDRDNLLSLTMQDYKKGLSMLRRPESTLPKAWRREILHMLHSRRKAEIEILCTSTATLLHEEPAFEEDCKLEEDASPVGENEYELSGAPLLAAYLASKINSRILELRRQDYDNLSPIKLETDDG
ncbi:endodeoxyribonuclease [Tulasnella sp. 403]|nr:endodeoxyribonuclease [Tulasnella sp. 403]